MHIFFSAIGGAGIGPLALIAHQAGYKVSGSDKQSSQYIVYLKEHGVTDIFIGQNKENIEYCNRKNKIDWLVYSSAVSIENPNSPELLFCSENNIKTSKRDELLNEIIRNNKLKLIAIAGTHGKSTTTAMVIWLFKELAIPISYSVGAKMNFGDMGEFHNKSEYFIYEADEFDYNFLSFNPYLSLITGVTWDHHEIFPTRDSYKKAFTDFIYKSESSIVWEDEHKYLNLNESNKIIIESTENIHLNQITLDGKFNRYDAYLAIRAVHELTHHPLKKLIDIINKFPGLQRRMEEIIPGLYSDYAHTPEKIRGAMSVSLEIAKKSYKDVVVLYEPLTDRRQHFIKNDYKDCFKGAKVVYWLPSYLAREDPNQNILNPEELISNLDDPNIAIAKKRDEQLKKIIEKHLFSGNIVVGMNGGGGDSLDEWLKQEFR